MDEYFIVYFRFILIDYSLRFKQIIKSKIITILSKVKDFDVNFKLIGFIMAIEKAVNCLIEQNSKLESEVIMVNSIIIVRFGWEIIGLFVVGIIIIQY